MPEFSFDPQTHTYTLDGRELISATGILRACGVIDGSWFNEAARARGEAVHAACQFEAEGDLEESSLAPEIAPYLEQYKLAVAALGFKPTSCEQPIYHKALLYACTPDQVGLVEGKLALLELKTGTMQPWTALQTALQSMAVWPEGFMSANRYGLELRPDGYKLSKFGEFSDFSMATAMVAVAKWKQANCKEIKNGNQ